MSSARGRTALLATLTALYLAQGIPLGLAAEYLPVALRQAHYSRLAIASLGWLQLPWQLKPLWAGIADRPAVRRHETRALFGIQLALALTVAAYAPFDVRRSPLPWFVLTAVCAFVAATQDIFVDALAVRSLAPADRGFGNIAQVAAYRLGMIAGGAGMLLLVDLTGPRVPLFAAAGVIAGAGAFAFVARPARASEIVTERHRSAWFAELISMLAHVTDRGQIAVLALIATYKLGPHIANAIIKPMVVDAQWTPREIGWAVVTVGTGASLLGAGLGGVAYRAIGERRALATGCVLHALTCVPLIAAAALHVPRGLTVGAIAFEHFASGLGTTVLFAALMTATHTERAALHYTVLTSANVVALGLGGLLGGWLGDLVGERITFGIAMATSLLPLMVLPHWSIASRRSAGIAQ